MARRKVYEVFEIGQRVKIKRPAVWYANVNGLTEDVVVQDVGAVGQIVSIDSFTRNAYLVRFDDGDDMVFHFHAASLEHA